jgi:hypothetical protein
MFRHVLFFNHLLLPHVSSFGLFIVKVIQ